MAAAALLTRSALLQVAGRYCVGALTRFEQRHASLNAAAVTTL